MSGLTVILRGHSQREYARKLIVDAPRDAIFNIREPGRTTPQNDKMWPMLTEISLARCEDRVWTTNTWKAGFMSAMGEQVLWYPGLDGRMPFPSEYRSKNMSKEHMSEMLEMIHDYGARHGVQWRPEHE